VSTSVVRAISILCHSKTCQIDSRSAPESAAAVRRHGCQDVHPLPWLHLPSPSTTDVRFRPHILRQQDGLCFGCGLSMACSLSIASALSVDARHKRSSRRLSARQATLRQMPHRHLLVRKYLRSLPRRHSVAILCRRYTVKWRVTCCRPSAAQHCAPIAQRIECARDGAGSAWRAGGPSDRVNTAPNAGVCTSARYHRDPTAACPRFQYLSAYLDLLNTYSNAVRRRRGVSPVPSVCRQQKSAVRASDPRGSFGVAEIWESR
jgi:hypothetical protein